MERRFKMMYRTHAPADAGPAKVAKIIVLSYEKRLELLDKRQQRETDSLCLPSIIGIKSVMLRGAELDIRFATSRRSPRDWWETVKITVLHMQTGKRFTAKGNGAMTVNDRSENETLIVMKPVWPVEYLGPDEHYRVEVVTQSGLRVHFLADKVRGSIKRPPRLPTAAEHRSADLFAPETDPDNKPCRIIPFYPRGRA